MSLPGPLVLVTLRLTDVKSQASGVQVDLIAALLENLRDVACILEFSQINIGPALLDSITNQLCRTSLTLGSDDGGLLLLAGLVDNEGSALGLLLGDLLGFDSRSEFGREGKVLWI